MVTIQADQYKSGMFNGFSITNESGVTYHYGLPAYSYGEQNYQQKISQTNGLFFNRSTKNIGYAYTWYLTRSPASTMWTGMEMGSQMKGIGDIG